MGGPGRGLSSVEGETGVREMNSVGILATGCGEVVRNGVGWWVD